MSKARAWDLPRAARRIDAERYTKRPRPMPGMNFGGKPQTTEARAKSHREGRLKAAIRRLQMAREAEKVKRDR